MDIHDEGFVHPISVTLSYDIPEFSSVALSEEACFGQCRFFLLFLPSKKRRRQTARARVVVLKILRVLRVLGGQNAFKINALSGQRSPFTG
jgi:hypothetical protein